MGSDLFCHFQKENDDCTTESGCKDTKKNILVNTIPGDINLLWYLRAFAYKWVYCNKQQFNHTIPWFSYIRFQLKKQCSEEIYEGICDPMAINSERLLRQYVKLHSHQPLGFHSLNAFTKGFTPVIPICYYNHISQKNKDVTVHHFASKLLSVISSYKIITAGIIVVDLWLFMVQIPLFTKISKASNLQSNNFKELDEILKQSSEWVYFGFLVGISAHIEASVENKSQFIFNIYSRTATKDIALKIGKGGLFGDIKKTNDALVKEMKKALL